MSRRTDGTASAVASRRAARPGRKPSASSTGTGALAPQQRGQQLDRRVVAPVQVVEHQHERLRAREQAEQPLRGAVDAVALVGDRLPHRRARAALRRQQRGQLVEQLGVPRLGEPEVVRRDVGVQRVGPDAERQVALELGRRAREHQAAALLGAPAQLAEQARLPDPRLALDGDAAGAPVAERLQRRVDLRELRLAPDRPSGAGLEGHGTASL